MTALTITAWLVISSGSGGDSMAGIDLPPWPSGLSSPIVRGEETCLLRDLADAVHYRLAACESLPGRCQARIDGAVATCKADALTEEGPGYARPIEWRDLAAAGIAGMAIGVLGAVMVFAAAAP